MTAVSMRLSMGECVARLIRSSPTPRATALPNLSRTIFSMFLQDNDTYRNEEERYREEEERYRDEEERYRDEEIQR